MANSTETHALHAPVEWAQRKDTVYVAICLEDCKNPSLTITDETLDFSGVGGSEKKLHKCHFEFYEPVDSKEVRRVDSDRRIQLIINKKNKGPFWPRLLKPKGHFWWCKVDFNKWKDEDELDNMFDQDSFMPGMDDMGPDFKFNEEDDDDASSSSGSSDLPALDDEEKVPATANTNEDQGTTIKGEN